MESNWSAVSLATVDTVKISVLIFIVEPDGTSVRNAVPDPVTALLLLVTATVPVNVLLNYPEFQNITKFQKILPALDKSFLSDYFNQNFSHELDEILIGEENADKILSECSIVSSPFNQGTVRGRIGVIGPKRIPYLQIQNILNNFTEIINSAG